MSRRGHPETFGYLRRADLDDQFARIVEVAYCGGAKQGVKWKVWESPCGGHYCGWLDGMKPMIGDRDTGQREILGGRAFYNTVFARGL